MLTGFKNYQEEWVGEREGKGEKETNGRKERGGGEGAH